MFGKSKLQFKKREIQRRRQEREDMILFDLGNAIFAGLGRGVASLFTGKRKKKKEEKLEFQKVQKYLSQAGYPVLPNDSNSKTPQKVVGKVLLVGTFAAVGFLATRYLTKK